MKKTIALLTALIMSLSLTACSEGGNENNNTDAANTAKPDSNVTESAAANPDATPDAGNSEETTEAAPVVEAEPIPDSPLYYYGFENTDGLTAVKQVADLGSLTGSTYGLAASQHEILIAEGQGAVGNALYLDGKYGVDFEMGEIADDSYTISFWYNADRVATYGPVLQMGRNVGMSNADATVTWINVTKTTWGTNNADIFPVVWNRNSSIGTEASADGVWPWGYAMDDEQHGKREWCLLTIVVDGNRYVADDGMERIGTKYYLNGELKHEANAENMFYQGISPEIFAGDGIEAHIGINYWDTIYKGFIDELYIFDEALTDGQVKTLFEMGNPPENPVAPEYDAPEEEEPAATEPAPAEPANAVETVDAISGDLTVTSFFNEKSSAVEMKSGDSYTFKFKNTSNGTNNWDNFVMAITGAIGDAYTGADKEILVIRADAWGWGGGMSDLVDPNGDGNALSFTSDVDWDNWAAGAQAGYDVEINVSRDGNTINYSAKIGEYNVSLNATSNTALPDSTYIFFTGENCVLSGITTTKN